MISLQPPTIGNRLKTIAGCIGEGEIVADIGCDHGYLAAYLVCCCGVPMVYASDIRQKPLHAAKKTVERWKLEERVQLFQSDGLTEIPQNVTTVVIAGMGGESMMRILRQADWIRRPGMQLVLQPMSFLPELRAFLYRIGFVLHQEIPVIDLPHYYLVMDAHYCGESRELSEREKLIGRLKASPKSEANSYLSNEYQKYQRMAEGLSHAKGEREKYRQCLKNMEYIRRRREEISSGDCKGDL